MKKKRDKKTNKAAVEVILSKPYMSCLFYSGRTLLACAYIRKRKETIQNSQKKDANRCVYQPSSEEREREERPSSWDGTTPTHAHTYTNTNTQIEKGKENTFVLVGKKRRYGNLFSCSSITV